MGHCAKFFVSQRQHTSSPSSHIQVDFVIELGDFNKLIKREDSSFNEVIT
jgi:hypothetical protein